MRCTIERMEEIIAKARLKKHTHVRVVSSDNFIYTGFKFQDGWAWTGAKPK